MPREPFSPSEPLSTMHRGIEVDLHLARHVRNENFVAEAIGNLAAFELQEERGEPLQWQVVRVEEAHHHHFRLVIRHPARALDLGLAHAVHITLDRLSEESEEELGRQFREAKAHGLTPVPLRHVHEAPDLWQDDFWNHLG